MTNNLSTQIRKSYTYLILFYDGSFYYGVRLCPKGKTPWQDTDYVGSPVTHRDKWNTTLFTKFILEIFDDYKLAQEKEKELIKPNLNNPVCLNEHAAGGFSRESCSKAGKIGGRKNTESGHIQNLGKEWGVINGRKVGRITGIKNIHKAIESNKNSDVCSRAGKIGGKISGRKNIESGHIQKLGKYCSESGHLKKIANIKFKCLITGYISTGRGLDIYQRARDIDTSLRERID